MPNTTTSVVPLVTLPIELWNIILTFTAHHTAKYFIYLAIVSKSFNENELEVLKTKYIYDYIICSNPLNKHIYHIYNNLDTIDTKIKYITNYSKIFGMICSLNPQYIINSNILKNYLLNKIETVQDKNKFVNLTIRLYKNNNVNNVNYKTMLKHL
jgi:hypothetical protein